MKDISMKAIATFWSAVLLISILACGGGGGNGSGADGGTSPGADTGVASCGGPNGQTCSGSNEFCKYDTTQSCGSGDAWGICTSQPQFCSQEYDPVCGCDGKTYGNPCMADLNGVSVEHEGECSTNTTNQCGTASTGSCSSGEYCEFPSGANCGMAGTPGTCKTSPQACAQNYNPVCGCDGQTYSNSCMANAQGVSVHHIGKCRTGCQSNSDCAGSEMCDFGTANGCGINGGGKCIEVPDACAQVWDPVCGCDGTTYSNECLARIGGTSVAYTGQCNQTQ